MADAFAVMREAMTGKAGIGKLALHGRECLVAVQPRDRGLVMYTLRHARELRRMDALDELDQLPETVRPDEDQLAQQVISTFEGDLDLTEFLDQYQEELRGMIDAKIAGREVMAPAEETPPKVVNLVDALGKSLDSVSDARKKPAAGERMPARATTRRKRARG